MTDGELKIIAATLCNRYECKYEIRSLENFDKDLEELTLKYFENARKEEE